DRETMQTRAVVRNPSILTCPANYTSIMDKLTHKTLLIVWHSRTGAARQLAEAAAQGARDVAVELEAMLNIELKQADHAQATDLLAAQAYLFCAPENLAALSGA